jgi:hypothetical protein
MEQLNILEVIYATIVKGRCAVKKTVFNAHTRDVVSQLRIFSVLCTFLSRFQSDHFESGDVSLSNDALKMREKYVKQVYERLITYLCT